MTKTKILSAALLVLGTAGIIMGADSCTDAASGLADGVCGECGKVSRGDATITGMAELDGIFKAVGDLKLNAGSVDADFDARLKAMAENVFAINTAGMARADLIAAIKTEFNAQIKANIDGDISLKYKAPKCSANVNVAVEASAQCEVKAGCSADVKCDPGEASFSCEGSCSGSCSAGCELPVCQVKLEPGELNCSGECSGSCTVELSAAAACEGKCEGTCSGSCSAYVENTEGEMECAGECDGTCEGSCTAELSAGASCEGSCSGECKISGPDAEVSCEGELKCEGSCSGECSGSCEGSVKAPRCEGQASCDASADCEAQASAQASANLECTPPSIELDYGFNASLDASAKADVMAKLDLFRAEMVGVVQGMFKLRALVDVEYAQSIGITPPTVSIKASIDGFMSALQSGELEIAAPGLALCALPAFTEAGTILTSLPGQMKATITAQLDVVAILGI